MEQLARQLAQHSSSDCRERGNEPPIQIHVNPPCHPPQVLIKPPLPKNLCVYQRVQGLDTVLDEGYLGGGSQGSKDYRRSNAVRGGRAVGGALQGTARFQPRGGERADARRGRGVGEVNGGDQNLIWNHVDQCSMILSCNYPVDPSYHSRVSRSMGFVFGTTGYQVPGCTGCR